MKTIRNISDAWHKQAKCAAAASGQPLNKWIEELIRQAVTKKGR